MLIEIRVDGGDAEEELRSFGEWLRQDEDIRRYATIAVEAGEPETGGLGASLELIKLLVDSGFQLSNLALAYAAWRASRTHRAATEIEVTVRRGETVVTLTSTDAEEAGKLLRALDRE